MDGSRGHDPQDRPWTQSVLTVTGYSLIDGLALPNKALAVVGLKPFDERTDKSLSVFSALAEINKLFQQIAAANVIAFNLPPIAGLGNAAGSRIAAANTFRCDTEGSRGRGGRARHCCQPEPGARQCLHDLWGLDAAGVFEIGPRAGGDFGSLDRRHIQRIADHDGRYLRQRLQSLWPHLASQGSGRRGRSQGGRGHLSGAGTDGARRSRSIAYRRRCRAGHGARLDHPL